MREIATIAMLLLLVWPVAGQRPGQKKEKPSAAQRDREAYLEQARRRHAVEPPTPGSLWSPQGRLADLAADDKARRVNDIVEIRILEQTRSQSDGSVKTQRQFSAKSGISGLLGQVGPRSGLQTLLSPTSSSTLDGQGQASSTTRLTASLAGRVVEVLPSGMLVVEAVREVEMNRERQTLILRGVIRPSDIAPDNSVLSTQIGNLEVQLKGGGTVSDSTRPPHFLIRALLRLVGF